MHRGLKIREAFLAKHIFGFAEHKALEKSRVCQTQRAAARFAEPPTYLPRSKVGNLWPRTEFHRRAPSTQRGSVCRA